jgi:hypothetical protein
MADFGTTTEQQAERDRVESILAQEMIEHPIGWCDICGFVGGHFNWCPDNGGGMKIENGLLPLMHSEPADKEAK